jgi:hypothetical protein
MRFPPLYVESSFDEIDGFLTVIEGPAFDGRPGFSFNRVRIFLAHTESAELLREFKTPVDRLEMYPPLQR